MQLRYETGLTGEEYVRAEAWRAASLEQCPNHPHGGCSLARHGTYTRKTLRGTRIARWYCPESHTTISLLPDCLAARLPGTVDELEAVVAHAEQATSLGAAADEVPDGHRVVKADYTGTGYDRGHLAPAGAMKWSSEAMSQSFFMSNMAPQVGNGFNRHIWKSLEQRVRRWACERGVLYVVTGPLYEERPIGQLAYDKDDDGVDDNGVLVDVPSHFFKLAFDPVRIEAIAFILPNEKLETKDLRKFLRSIDDIEDRARLDVLPMIWDGAEEAIENHKQPRLWEKPQRADCAALG